MHTLHDKVAQLTASIKLLQTAATERAQAVRPVYMGADPVEAISPASSVDPTPKFAFVEAVGPSVGESRAPLPSARSPSASYTGISLLPSEDAAVPSPLIFSVLHPAFKPCPQLSHGCPILRSHSLGRLTGQASSRPHCSLTVPYWEVEPCRRNRYCRSSLVSFNLMDARSDQFRCVPAIGRL